MPQTSPMNWMMISLMMITMMNMFYSNNLLMALKPMMKNHPMNKKNMSWLW